MRYEGWALPITQGVVVIEQRPDLGETRWPFLLPRENAQVRYQYPLDEHYSKRVYGRVSFELIDRHKSNGDLHACNVENLPNVISG